MVDHRSRLLIWPPIQVFNVHEISVNCKSLRDEERLQRSPTPQRFQPSQLEHRNEKKLVDYILKAIMKELQEEPILEKMHDIDIPFELEQQEESFPSLELLDDLQLPRTLVEMHNFWVEQHMQVAPTVRLSLWGSTCTCTQLTMHLAKHQNQIWKLHLKNYAFGELNGEYPLLLDIMCNLKIRITTLLFLLVINKNKQGCILMKLMSR